MNEEEIIERVLNTLFPVGRNDPGRDHSREGRPTEAIRLALKRARESQQQEIDRLRAEWREPDENTPEDALMWWWNEGWEPRFVGWACGEFSEVGRCILAKEGQGPPPDDWQPQEEKVCTKCGGSKVVLVAPGIPGIRANSEDIHGPCPRCASTTQEGEKND